MTCVTTVVVKVLKIYSKFNNFIPKYIMTGMQYYFLDRNISATIYIIKIAQRLQGVSIRNRMFCNIRSH